MCRLLNILLGNISIYTVILFLTARATLEILIPDFVKQTSEEKPIEGDELEVLLFFRSEITDFYLWSEFCCLLYLWIFIAFSNPTVF